MEHARPALAASVQPPSKRWCSGANSKENSDETTSSTDGRNECRSVATTRATFQMPELLRHIASFAEFSDVVQLTTVSRACNRFAGQGTTQLIISAQVPNTFLSHIFRRFASDRVSNLHVQQRQWQSTEFLQESIERCAKALQELHIPECPIVTDPWVETLVNDLPELKSLVVRGCPSFTDHGLTTMAKCPSLRMLDARDCPTVTMRGVRSAFKCNARLTVRMRVPRTRRFTTDAQG